MLQTDPSLCQFFKYNTFVPVDLIAYYIAKNIQYRL